MSTSRVHHEYTGGRSVSWWDVMIYVEIREYIGGSIMSTGGFLT